MIDMHVHSTVSDGTDTPAALAAMGACFGAMALSDHDTLAGAAEFLAAPGCARRLAGVEIDVRPGEGYHR